MNLRDRYAQLVATGEVSSDPIQAAVVERLDDLRERLIAAHEAQSSVVGRLIGKLNNHSIKTGPRGLYLWGGVGRGKTWLMDLFYDSLPFPERRRRHFHRFMNEVHMALNELEEQEDPLDTVAAQIAADTQVLCFDELFVSDIADAMILGGLFAGLFRRGVTLVATSNIAPRDLYKDGLQRARFLPAIELIKKNTDVVQVKGSLDYRLRRLAQAGTYLLSTAPDTPARLEALFSEVAGHSEETDGSVEILNRPIPVVRQSENAAWFTFNALCAGPRSQDDYIEIARNFQSVIVSDVPVFNTQLEDEARRFIALVDELYDRRVNFIASAAAPPTALYRGERLTQPFERTASRLIEMQSEKYLASQHRP
jgi:cell division protein ZapE